MLLPYRLRQKLRWAGRPLGGFSAAELDVKLPGGDRASDLIREYRLERWKGLWSRATYDEVLGTLDLLDRVRPAWPGDGGFAEAPRVLDVGSKNWQYLGAVATWLERWGASQGARITGVELDAYRMYANARTRASCARYFMRSCERVLSGQVYDYVADDVRRVSGIFDQVIWLLPFLHESTHRSWGLPASAFAPDELFRHVASLLRLGGAIVLVNQGEWEWEIAKAMLEPIEELKCERHEVVEGSLHASPHSLFLSFWIRRRDAAGPLEPGGSAASGEVSRSRDS